MSPMRAATSGILLLMVVACGTGGPGTGSAASTSTTASDRGYEDACAGVPAEQRAMCPVGAWTASFEDVDNGVLLHLRVSAPPPEETQKRMRCHRAWMEHAPENAMPRCPIGSPGLTITAAQGKNGTDLSLVAAKPEDIAEVRRRAHAALAK